MYNSEQDIISSASDKEVVGLLFFPNSYVIFITVDEIMLKDI